MSTRDYDQFVHRRELGREEIANYLREKARFHSEEADRYYRMLSDGLGEHTFD